MSVFVFIVAALCCYRLTVLIARDAGPYRVFARLRKVDRFSKLLSCPYCVSVWVAILVEVSLYFSGIKESPVLNVLLVFAFSAIAIILDRTFSADHTA